MEEWEMPCPAAGGIPCGAEACLQNGCEEEWMEKHIDPPETVMRDSDEPCGLCGEEKTAELVRTSDRQVLHRYCTNPECERGKWL